MDVQLGLRLAGIGSRAFAQVIDLALLYLVEAIVLCIGVFSTLLVFERGDRDGAWVFAGLLLLTSLVAAGWFVGFELAWDGQTPGKRLVGIRVVTSDGRVPDAGAIFLRNVLRFVDFLPGGYLVGLLVMLGSPQHRRLGDIVADTLVVANEKAPAVARRWPAGFSDAEIAILEKWFARAETLPRIRREVLAAKLLSRLGRVSDPGLSAAETLDALCPRIDGPREA